MKESTIGSYGRKVSKAVIARKEQWYGQREAEPSKKKAQILSEEARKDASWHTRAYEKRDVNTTDILFDSRNLGMLRTHEVYMLPKNVSIDKN